MRHTIIFIKEVAKRTGTSVATVRREVANRRKGQGLFPLPISPPNAKGRWLESDIDNYIESLASVNATTCVPAQSETQKAKEFAERQKRAQQTLARHGITKGGQQ